MMYKSCKLCFFLLCILLCSCHTGYEKENGGWVWVTNDESNGRRAHPIEYADPDSFEVLHENDFAKDQSHVYYQGRMIRDADPDSFEVLSEMGYSKDYRHVYLDVEKVVLAHPRTFELLEFPYARDQHYLFCGNLPIRLPQTELQEFRVTNEDKLMAGMKSTIVLSHFMELYPEYSWLDTLGIKAVILGEWATGETPAYKIKGFSIQPKK